MTEEKIYGPVIICNEWGDECQDFEMTDYNYIMSVIHLNS